MPEQALQIAWMRAVLRMYARADVATWTDEEVVATFATLRERPVSFEEWAARMGLGKTEPQPTADDPEALVSLARATAPNLKVEVQQNG